MSQLQKLEATQLQNWVEQLELENYLLRSQLEDDEDAILTGAAAHTSAPQSEGTQRMLSILTIAIAGTDPPPLFWVRCALHGVSQGI